MDLTVSDGVLNNPPRRGLVEALSVQGLSSGVRKSYSDVATETFLWRFPTFCLPSGDNKHEFRFVK